MRFLNIVVSAILLGIAVIPVQAQTSRSPSTEEMVSRLSGKGSESPTPASRFRGQGNGVRGVTVEGNRTSANNGGDARSIDLEINFDYNSANLTPDARLILDRLGAALKAPELQGARFLIGGHTDGKGNDAYNLNLSRQRAQSVATYLVRQHGVANGLLTVEGYGKSRLVDPANPESAINRRVQVVNLGQGGAGR